MQIKGYLFILLAAAMWGLIGPVAKLAFAEGVTPMEVAFWRGALAWIFFGTHALIKRETHFETRDLPAIAFFAVVGVSVFYGSYQLAVDSGGAALASVLLYTAPAWVMVLSRIFLKETVTPVKVVALFLTIGGVAAISWGGGVAGKGVNFMAVASGLTAGFSYSTYFILGKYFSDRYTSPNLFLYMLPIGSAILFPFVQFAPKSPVAWAALLCLAFVSTYIAYYSYYLGLKYLEASRASITATLEPVMAGVIAYFWWGELFNALGFMGSGLILSAVALMIWDGARISRTAVDAPTTG